MNISRIERVEDLGTPFCPHHRAARLEQWTRDEQWTRYYVIATNAIATKVTVMRIWLTTVLVAASLNAASGQPKDRATVLLFISVECPVSNRYAPEIQRLYKTFGPRGVRFWLVYPNPRETPAIIAKHLKDYGYPDIVLRDRNNPLLKSVKPTVTPEAAVFNNSGTLAYQGRIDDRFVELLRERPSATTHDLEQALTAMLAGKPVIPPTTQAVGCFIADMR